MKAIWIGLGSVGILAFAACSDLPELGTCGNGIVERTAGENCEGTDHCTECRHTCSLDLAFTDADPTQLTCAVPGECCAEDELCGVDSLCYRPSGRFANPRGTVAFPATQAVIADVDGDRIGDAFGIAGDQVSFRFGDSNGDLTRSGTTRIPPLSRPDSRVAFLDITTDLTSVGFATASVVTPTRLGFAILVAIDNQLSSPPLPELEYENETFQPDMLGEPPIPDSGGGPYNDLGLASAPSVLGDLVTLVAQQRSDAPPSSADHKDRVTVRVFNDRDLVAQDTTPCGMTDTDDFTLPAPTLPASLTETITELRLAPGGDVEGDGRVEEYAFVSIARVVPPAMIDSTAPAPRLCMFQTKNGPRPFPPPPAVPPAVPAPLLDEAVINLPTGSFVSRLLPGELDGDTCPELVIELTVNGMQTVRVVDTERVLTACQPIQIAMGDLIRPGHLVGVGNLGDFAGGADHDEILIDQGMFTHTFTGHLGELSVMNPQDPGAVLQLPDALDEAIIVDINRDGTADIVATGDAASDLTVILSTSHGYAPRGVPSVGPLRDLVTGDFDADTFPDVAALEETSGDARLVVAFGGLHGPDRLDTLGQMREARSLRAFRDQFPFSANDPFGDLTFIHSPLGPADVNGVRKPNDEQTQFSGSGNRAMTSQIDLSGFFGPAFGRTMVTGQILAPFNNGLDFCSVSMTPGVNPVVTAFCVGGQGAELAAGALFAGQVFPRNTERLDALPLVVAAKVGHRPPPNETEHYPVLVAMNTDDVRQLIVMAPPPSLMPGPDVAQVSSKVIDLELPPLVPSGAVSVSNIRVVELDGDPDSELVLAVEVVADGFSYHQLIRIDLSEQAGEVLAVATYLLPQSRDFGHCTDAVEAELGEVLPNGRRSDPRTPELVVLCFTRNKDGHLDQDSVGLLHAIYRTTEGPAPDGPPPVFLVGVVGKTNGRIGRIIVGDVTGDRLDDLLVITDSANDAVAVAVIQCPEHDTTACPRVNLGVE